MRKLDNEREHKKEAKLKEKAQHQDKRHRQTTKQGVKTGE